MNWTKNNGLVFSVLPKQKIFLMEWLENNGYDFRCIPKENYFLFDVNIGMDPGKAGRAYDIGRELALMENRSAGQRKFKVARELSPDAKPRYRWKNGPYVMVRKKASEL